MSADTLTDADAEVLRKLRYGRTLSRYEQIPATHLRARGLAGGSTVRGWGLTPAGREALAAHEARHEAGDRRG